MTAATDRGTSSWRDAGLGWDDAADDHGRWHTAGSVALVTTAALYWSMLWAARGFPPVPQLLLRLHQPSSNRGPDA